MRHLRWLAGLLALGLFLAEAGNSFHLYIMPLLGKFPPRVIAGWTAQFGPPEDEEAWFLKALAIRQTLP